MARKTDPTRKAPMEMPTDRPISLSLSPLSEKGRGWEGEQNEGRRKREDSTRRCEHIGKD